MTFWVEGYSTQKVDQSAFGKAAFWLFRCLKAAIESCNRAIRLFASAICASASEIAASQEPRVGFISFLTRLCKLILTCFCISFILPAMTENHYNAALEAA